MIIELIAVISYIACVFLATKKNILTWPMGLVATTLYFFIFLNTKLYADMSLQVIFTLQGLYGWYAWISGKNKETKEFIIKRIKTAEEVLIYIFIIIISWLMLGKLFSQYTDASLPYIDSFLTTLSIVATYLLSKKYLENWIIWIVADFLYIFMFMFKELYLSAILYFILLLLSTKGFLNWNKLLNEYYRKENT